MTATKKDPVFVVLQLSGGNDYFNTVIPYNDPLYRDNRPAVGLPEDQIIKLDDELGFNPAMQAMKRMYDQGNVAVINGVGYANSPRSHFRSMDIWHTCEPETVGTEGWLGRATRELDPGQENVISTVNIGQGLPRALVVRGVPVASVPDLATYGLFTGMEAEQQRDAMLDTFSRVYSPAIGRGQVMEYLGSTGLDAMKGADILKEAPARYSSTVEYAASPVARRLRDIAQIHLAGLGTRIFYTEHSSFDTHASQVPGHHKLWTEVSEAVEDFFEDLREHDAADNVVMLLFSEFGRRVHDNGSGTDHGAAGVAFMVGETVNGGIYGEYPSRKAENLQQGDLVPTHDFRGVYTTILENWLGLEAKPIVNGNFENFSFL